MTEIRLSWLRPDLQETYTDATGDVSFTPTARHLHDLAVVVAAQQRAHVEGTNTVSLVPTGPDWCWEVRFHPRRATPWTVHVTVPDVTGVVEFVDLPQVDPNTLEPVEVDEPLWWAALQALEREPGPEGSRGPQGEPGQQGPKGEKGDKGEPGKDAELTQISPGIYQIGAN